MRKNYLKSIIEPFSSKDPYFQINILFAGIIILMLAYSGIFSSSKNNYPVKCNHKILYGIECETCGLSRGFSEIMRGNFKKAVTLNPHSLPVFLFFLIQLSLRLTILLLITKSRINQNIIGMSDIIISSGLFIICFRKIIQSWLAIF